jgi:hypothetical protein
MASAMKMKMLTPPTIQAADVSPNASAIVGVTLLGDVDDVLAVLRTAVLLARNLGASLSLQFPGTDPSPFSFSEAPSPARLSVLLGSVGPQLRKLISERSPMLASEVTVTVASFVSKGTISMRVRSVNTSVGEQENV